jgi:parallel beta helix pectate lyase-like protein/Big-like domain-containing protein
MISIRCLAGAALLALVACSSGGDSGTPPVNEPPTIAFSTNALAVPKSQPVDLTVDVSDPDSDPLTITWDITRGSLAAQNSAKTVMRWSTPSTVGTDTVTVSVSDGSMTRKTTAVIKVATLLTSSVALPSYTKANSPYILRPTGVNPKVLVQGAGTTIEAGSELYIDAADMLFDVLSDFQAHGTDSEPIVIRPNNRALSCADADDRGWWTGIQGASDVSTDGFLDFEHVEVWYADMAIRLEESSGALLRDCKIRCSGKAGILIDGFGSLRVFDSQITDGETDGISIAALSSLPDSVRVEGCKISFNDNAGINMDLNDVGQNVPIIVEFNEIEFNGSYGIALTNSVFPSIHYNSFRGNGDNTVLNLFLAGGYPDPVSRPTLDATCNFWGSATNSAATVDLTIRDSLDTSTVHTRVDSNPWLNANPITTPPNCSP